MTESEAVEIKNSIAHLGETLTRVEHTLWTRIDNEVVKRIDEQIIPRQDITNGRVNRLDERVDSVEQWKEHIDGERGWQKLVNDIFVALIGGMVGVLLAAVTGLSGCNGFSPPDPPPPAHTHTPRATEAVSTPTATATASPAPSETLAPTNAPTATQTPLVTVEPTQTPDPLNATPTVVLDDCTPGPNQGCICLSDICDAEYEWLVRRGDTLWLMQEQCGVDRFVIAERNGLAPPYPIVIGTVIIIPGVEGCE